MSLLYFLYPYQALLVLDAINGGYRLGSAGVSSSQGMAVEGKIFFSTEGIKQGYNQLRKRIPVKKKNYRRERFSSSLSSF